MGTAFTYPWKKPGGGYDAPPTNIFGKPMKAPQSSWDKPLRGWGSVVQSNSPESRRNDDMMKQLQAMWNMGQIANGPQDQAINNNIASYQQQLGLVGANQQMQTGYINQDAGFGRERIGLNREGLGVQQGALNRAGVLDPRLHQLSLEEWKQRGEQNIFQREGQDRQLSSQATTAGSLQSQGARQGFSDIAKQLEFGQRDVLRGTQRENLSFEERAAQRQDQQKQLDLAAKGLNIDGRELESRTQRALQELGLSSSIKVQEITRAINDLNAGRYNPLQAILGTIYQASGVRPVANSGRR